MVIRFFFLRKAREPWVNCTFILYDYQPHHFPKIDSSAALLFFSHSRNADTLCHDYYHIQSISVNLIITVLVAKYQEMETEGKNKYHSLPPVFRNEANKSSFKRILFLTTTFKNKK